MINGEEISQEEYDNLSSMNEYAATLKNTLSEIETKIYNGEVTHFTVKDKTARNSRRRGRFKRT